MRLSVISLTVAIGMLAVLFAGCSRSEPPHWQGYFEAEYVYVSSPIGGRLDTLAVSRGNRVSKNAPLFALERSAELAAQAEAAADLAAASARLSDASKGARPSELGSLEARAQEAQANAELAKLELERQTKLLHGQAISQNDYDKARLNAVANRRAVEKAKEDLETARLPARPDLVRAAEAQVDLAIAAKARADWAVDQKIQTASTDGLVYDTLYRVGEYAPAGSPIVVLLPPGSLKVRFFADEGSLAKFPIGTRVSVQANGRPALAGRVSYVSPQAEYTPPVLYNRDNRSKLSYMVEVRLDSPDETLHAGQPLDVTLSP